MGKLNAQSGRPKVNKNNHKIRRNRAEIGQTGFTLAEIVVVLTIVGVMLAIGFIKLTKGQRVAQVRAAAAQLVADLQFAQETAIATGREVRVHLDPDNDRYYLTWSDGELLRTPAGHRPFIVRFGIGKFKSVHLHNTGLNGGLLRFRPNGHPMDGGGNLGQEKLVANLNESYQVYVQPVTGSVRIVHSEEADD